MRYLLAAAALTIAAQASATPAMSVLTVNAQDPMAYMQWAQSSGPVIGEAIDASIGGICLGSAGYAAPGELYYWHVFDDHATAMQASIYDDAVMQEAGKLTTGRSLASADAFSVAMAVPRDWSVGDSFSSWNLTVSTDDPSLYMQQLARITAVAGENGFDDVSVSAYGALTGPQAGNLLVAVQAPSAGRLGEFLDQINSDWMSPIMADLAGIRAYEHGATMDCMVVYVGD